VIQLQTHQLQQKKVVDLIDSALNQGSVPFSTVEPVADFSSDPRLTLTSVHFPGADFIATIRDTFITPLQKIDQDHYYYQDDLLHATIKNVRTIANPPTFNEKDIQTVKEILEDVAPKYPPIEVFFYRLLLFPNNVSLIGTTSEHLDNIILELDERLAQVGVSDDKTYINNTHFFCNITLARFINPYTNDFKEKVAELSAELESNPISYSIDSVTLLTANAVMKKRKDHGSWQFESS